MTPHPNGFDLAAKVAALEMQLSELVGRLDDHDATAATQPAVTLAFPAVEAWVNGLFLPMFGWRVDGQRWHWCPQWWRHAEAIWRLELLWRSWEVSRLQPTGMSNWSVELDRHLRELLGEDSPFRQCRVAEADRVARHVDQVVATAEVAPLAWWK